MASKKFETIDGFSSIGVADFQDEVTFVANVEFGSNTVVVDTVNDRLGIGKVPIQGSVDIAGNIHANSFVGSGSGLTGVTAADSDTVDGLHGPDLLRSNAGDTYQDGQLLVSNASIVVADGILRINDNQQLHLGTGADVIVTGNNAGVSVSGSNVDINSGTLFIDTLNGRVGIGRTNPTTKVHINGAITVTGGSSTNWNTAYAWGDHSQVGYIVDGGVSSQKITFNAGVRLNDNDIIELGSSADSEIFHNGSDLHFDLNIGDLIIRDGATVRGTFQRTKGRMTANAFAPGLKTVSPGTTTTFNLTTGTNFVVTLNQNTTFAFTTDTDSYGMSGTLIIKQDATGGRTFTLPVEAKTPVGGSSINQITTPNSVSVLGYFIVDASTILVNYIGDFQ